HARPRVRASRIRRPLTVRAVCGPLLESIQFLRQYSGPPLEEGRQSLSFRLTIGSPERTLSSEETTEVRARIIEGMRGLAYELRCKAAPCGSTGWWQNAVCRPAVPIHSVPAAIIRAAARRGPPEPLLPPDH